MLSGWGEGAGRVVRGAGGVVGGTGTVIVGKAVLVVRGVVGVVGATVGAVGTVGRGGAVGGGRAVGGAGAAGEVGVTVEAGTDSGGLEPALTVARGGGLPAPAVDRGRGVTVEEMVGCSAGGRVTVSLTMAVVVEEEVGGCTIASATGDAAVDVRTAGRVTTTCWDSAVITQNRAPTTKTPASVSPSPTATAGLVS